mmetsp:Transcript_77916/g.167172  ORF Transcript_77916/g.167172 Transcript_77916/m.167172 type:complete len:204 (-) Transcript_77916:716-1327(-)
MDASKAGQVGVGGCRSGSGGDAHGSFTATAPHGSASGRGRRTGAARRCEGHFAPGAHRAGPAVPTPGCAERRLRKLRGVPRLARGHVGPGKEEIRRAGGFGLEQRFPGMGGGLLQPTYYAGREEAVGVVRDRCERDLSPRGTDEAQPCELSGRSETFDDLHRRVESQTAVHSLLPQSHGQHADRGYERDPERSEVHGQAENHP